MTQDEDAPTEDATERTRPGAWTALRPPVLRPHFRAGVFVAPFILVAAVTGPLYVWTPQIEEAAYADLLRVEPVGETLPLHDQVRVALTVLTVALPAVVVWGCRMRWQRRPTRSRVLGVGRPYPRGRASGMRH